VAYALRITDLDPIHFDLIFERFLNPERREMPDIDIDFCYERRGDVIEYVRDKYGRDAVGQIITFGTMKSRAVIRDVGRTLGFEPSETDRIAKMIPNGPADAMTVEGAIKKIPDVRDLYKKDQRHRQLFDYSMTLEGLSRHASVHAAGIVIAPGPIADYVPVCIQSGKGAGSNGSDEPQVVTQYDMKCLDDVGMLKMDFLGLKTLTVIKDAVAMVEERVGSLRHPGTEETYETIDALPLDDPEVYQMLARGGTSGVFQFESKLAAEKLRAMKCDRFEDLIATKALIRPGPLDSGMTDVYIKRKLGREAVTYPHPDLAATLEATFGVIVYQEQVMRIANVLAGFTLGEADALRKAVGKKIPKLIREQLTKFVDRATERGVELRVATDLAEQIETFGRYGFNRSHSAAYSLIAYHTAWLKAHYPAEFMAGLLSSVLDKTDDVVKYIAECREMGRSVDSAPDGIEVLAPDVNQSGWKFRVTGAAQIRFGLGAVRGVGAAAVSSIIAAREKDAEFTSLFDFLERVDTRALNKRSAEALIAAGALDAFGARSQLAAGLEAAYGEVQARQAEEAAGQVSLFGGGESAAEARTPTLPDLPEWPEAERLAREKEALGFFISGHPLDRWREVVRAFEPVTTASLRERPGDLVEIACVVTGIARQVSRKDGTEWARLTIEDFQGTATVLAFREPWEKHRDLLTQDAAVIIEGRVSDRERDEADPPLFLERSEPLKGFAESGRVAIQIDLELGSDLSGDVFSAARAIVEAHPGSAALELKLGQDNGASAPLYRSRSLRVDPSTETVTALRELLGRDRIRLVRARGTS
jgi:DNA polymerase-3 subunit alpha